MAFIVTPLPPCISDGSESTPVAQVDIARAPSGYEQRVGRRSAPMRRFNINYRIRRQEDLYDVISHFETMEGPLHSFPFRDRLDDRSGAPGSTPTSTDVVLGYGDGVTTTFQLRKPYTRGMTTRYRNILLPISGTVLIAVDGTLKTETTHYTVNYDIGVVTFTGGNTPTGGSPGQEVTAGFQYRCKVRFDSNELPQTYEGFKVAGASSIALIEVLA